MDCNYFFLMAAQKSSGQTTIAYNISAALQKQEKNVLIVSLYPNERLLSWGNSSQFPVSNQSVQIPGVGTIVSGDDKTADCLVLDAENSEAFSFVSLFSSLRLLDYPCIFFLTGYPSGECLKNLASHLPPEISSHFLLVSSLETPQASMTIRVFLESFQEIFHREIDLIIPNKLKVREWESNSRQLLELGQWFGYEKILDMLPVCSRIHELHLDHKTVWEVPVNQIRLAFQKLLDLLVEMSVPAKLE